VDPYYLYLAQRENESLIFLSPEPSFDCSYLCRTGGWKKFSILTEALPAGIAARLLLKIGEKLASSLQPRRSHGVEKLLEECGVRLISEAYSSSTQSLPSSGELGALEQLLRGRLLRFSEIARLTGVVCEQERRNLLHALQVLCLTRRIDFLPALVPFHGDLFFCQRCGWQGFPELVSCSSCGREDCCSCPECLIMGKVSLCEALFTASDAPVSGGRGFRKGTALRQVGLWRPIVFSGADVSEDDPQRFFQNSREGKKAVYRRQIFLNLGVEFTPPQKAAVDALLKFGEKGAASKECLVWAACGAGKTEVTFPLIASALRKGERVLFATPRREVVLEVASRMERAFGEKMVVALYGGSGNAYKKAPIVVATTHQTLRFHRAFDMVILDEGDAFPYPGNRMLHFGVQEARCFEGKVVYLTATPDQELLKKARSGSIDLIKIPARPHGFPLPEPRFLKVNPFPRGCLEHSVLEIIRDAVEKSKAQLFIFVPTVEMTRLVGKALREAVGKPPLENFRPEWIEWSFASDQNRFEKRERFYAGKFPVLVTTTIMERGVTVPRVHVIVLFADHAAVFDTPTLVQIAGRCGRSPDYPRGEVWFVAPTVTREMEEALEQIRAFNDEAMAAGYLTNFVAKNRKNSQEAPWEELFLEKRGFLKQLFSFCWTRFAGRNE